MAAESTKSQQELPTASITTAISIPDEEFEGGNALQTNSSKAEFKALRIPLANSAAVRNSGDSGDNAAFDGFEGEAESKEKSSRFDSLFSAILQSSFKWQIASVICHLIIGAQPVLARYLQTRSHLPSLSLMAVSNGVAALLVAPQFIRQLYRREVRLSNVLRRPLLYAFVFVVLIRTVTNVLSSRFTLAVYVQLITMLSPFVVFLLSIAFLKERFSKNIVIACAITLAGSFLIIGGGRGDSSNDNSTNTTAAALTSLFHSTPDWNIIGLHSTNNNVTFMDSFFQFELFTGLDWTDAIGLGLAFVSMICWSLYMVLIRVGQGKDLTGHAMFFFQVLPVSLFLFIASAIIGEDWSTWLTLEVTDWVMLAIFIVVIIWFAFVLQIFVVGAVGASASSSIMALRLVSTILLSAVLLGESIANFWKITGAAIVLAAVSWFLWKQHRQAKQQKQLRQQQQQQQQQQQSDVIGTGDELEDLNNNNTANIELLQANEMENERKQSEKKDNE